jgi:hypothetical protein
MIFDHVIVGSQVPVVAVSLNITRQQFLWLCR